MSLSESHFSSEFIIDDDFYLTLHNPFSYSFRFENGNIYLDIENNAGSIATFFDTFVSTTAFVEENMSIFPNPTEDLINIEGIDFKIEFISIFDLNGKEVLKFESGNTTNLNISTLNHGVYLMRIVTSKGTIHRKIVKK